MPMLEARFLLVFGFSMSLCAPWTAVGLTVGLGVVSSLAVGAILLLSAALLPFFLGHIYGAWCNTKGVLGRLLRGRLTGRGLE